MKKIIAHLKPFAFQQTVYFYDENGKEFCHKIATSKISFSIFDLADTKDVTEIYLAGSKIFTEKIAKEIKEAEIVKYDNLKINIHLI